MIKKIKNYFENKKRQKLIQNGNKQGYEIKFNKNFKNMKIEKEYDLKKQCDNRFIPETRNETERLLFTLYQYNNDPYKTFFMCNYFNFDRKVIKNNNGYLIKNKNRIQYEILLEKKLFEILKIGSFAEYEKLLIKEGKMRKIKRIKMNEEEFKKDMIKDFNLSEIEINKLLDKIKNNNCKTKTQDL